MYRDLLNAARELDQAAERARIAMHFSTVTGAAPSSAELAELAEAHRQLGTARQAWSKAVDSFLSS